MPPRMAVRNPVRPVSITNLRVNKVPRAVLDLTHPVSNFGFEVTMSYANGFPYPVVVSMRNGLAVTIPPINEKWSDTPDFTVYVRYRFARNVKIDSHRLLDVIPDDASMEMKALKEAILESKVNVIRNGNECVLMYSVDKQLFEKHCGAIYLQPLDVALSMNSAEQPVFHPESVEGMRLKVNDDVSGLNYHVYIVDKEGRYGKRWVNIGGKVFPVMPVRDSDEIDGVYLSISGHTNQSQVEKIYYTYDQATTELMLFASESDAITLGNVAEVKRREFETMQHEQRVLTLRMESEHRQNIQSLELELAKQKQEKADRESDLSKQIAALKKSEYKLEKESKKREAKYAREKAKRESRMSEEKDYYERRSYERKDSSEFIKWLPPIILGAGMLISKFL